MVSGYMCTAAYMDLSHVVTVADVIISIPFPMHGWCYQLVHVIAVVSFSNTTMTGMNTKTITTQSIE